MRVYTQEHVDIMWLPQWLSVMSCFNFYPELTVQLARLASKLQTSQDT